MNPYVDAAGESTRFAQSTDGLKVVTGDGLGNLLVGAPDNPPGMEFGRVFLFDATTGAELEEISSPNSTTEGHFGECVRSVPDIDGDGNEDFVVGAPDEDVPMTGAGSAYVYRYIDNVGAFALLHELFSPNPMVDGEFGAAVAGIPDVDGDGAGDVVVGAPNEDSGATAAGRAYVFSGATGALIYTLASPSPNSDAAFGASLTSIPDVDADGVDDIVVGAPAEGANPGSPTLGSAHAFSGATGAWIRELDCGCESNYGIALAGIPDMNGDGAGDLVVGARSSTFRGRVLVVDGATGGLVSSYFSPNGLAGDGFGTSVADAGDTTGDGPTRSADRRAR